MFHFRFPADPIELSRDEAGLSEPDVLTLREELSVWPGKWEIDVGRDCDGATFLLLVPSDADDDALSFSVHRGSADLSLEAWKEDECLSLGPFRTVAELMVRARLLVEVDKFSGAMCDTRDFSYSYRLIAGSTAMSLD